MDKTWIKSKRQTKNEFKYHTKDDVSILTDGITIVVLGQKRPGTTLVNIIEKKTRKSKIKTIFGNAIWFSFGLLFSQELPFTYQGKF